jgi:folate-binding protein YgfZ
MSKDIVTPDEYHAVRTGAGLVDRSGRGKIGLTGRDRASYLQGLLTNDIVALTAGAGCYAAYLTPQGRMIADMRVIETGERIVLDVNLHQKEMLLNRLDQFIFSEQVKLEDLTSLWSEPSVHGPRAAAVVSAALATLEMRLDGGASKAVLSADVLSKLAEYNHVTVRSGESFAIVVATRETGELGFDLYVRREDDRRIREELRKDGASDVGAETFDVLRIEAGRPRFDVDMDEETLPLEAGIEDRAISLTKGCYVGQEVIIRVLHRGGGRVARKLVGLKLTGEGSAGVELPESDAGVFSGDRAIGRVTSAAFSPRMGQAVALGYVHRDFTAPGTAVTIAHGASRLPAEVASLPFLA